MKAGAIKTGIGLIDGLLFNDGRKFGTGLWIIILSTLMKFFGPERMDANKWSDMVIVAAILIGGGTVADRWLGKKGDKDAPPPSPGA